MSQNSTASGPFHRSMCAGWITLIMLISASEALAQSRSIFDSDWTPPKRSAPAIRPDTPATTQSTTAPSLTKTAPGASDFPESLAPPKVARRTIPTSAEQGAVRKVMKELFARQLADRSPNARRQLAETLLAQAEKSSDAPVDRFVLLAAANEAAVEGASIPLAMQAVEGLSAGYAVDELALKAASITAIGPRAGATGPDASRRNVLMAAELVRELAAAGDFETALRVSSAVQPAAAMEADTRAGFQSLIRDLMTARDSASKAGIALDVLKKTPKDADANADVGKHLCLVLGDWAAGLPYLLKGSDGAMKMVAHAELLRPALPEEIANLGDAWWELSLKQREGLPRTQAMNHAAALYRTSLAGIVGLRHEQLERRIAEAAALSGPFAIATTAQAPGPAIIVRSPDAIRVVDLEVDAPRLYDSKPLRKIDQFDPALKNFQFTSIPQRVEISYQIRVKRPGTIYLFGFAQKDPATPADLFGADARKWEESKDAIKGVNVNRVYRRKVIAGETIQLKHFEISIAAEGIGLAEK